MSREVCVCLGEARPPCRGGRPPPGRGPAAVCGLPSAARRAPPRAQQPRGRGRRSRSADARGPAAEILVCTGPLAAARPRRASLIRLEFLHCESPSPPGRPRLARRAAPCRGPRLGPRPAPAGRARAQYATHSPRAPRATRERFFETAGGKKPPTCSQDFRTRAPARPRARTHMQKHTCVHARGPRALRSCWLHSCLFVLCSPRPH